MSYEVTLTEIGVGARLELAFYPTGRHADFVTLCGTVDELDEVLHAALRRLHDATPAGPVDNDAVLARFTELGCLTVGSRIDLEAGEVDAVTAHWLIQSGRAKYDQQALGLLVPVSPPTQTPTTLPSCVGGDPLKATV